MEKEYNSFNFNEIDNIKFLPKWRNISKSLANDLINNLKNEEKIDYINQDIEIIIKKAESILFSLKWIKNKLKDNEINELWISIGELSIVEITKDKEEINMYKNHPENKEIQEKIEKFQIKLQKYDKRIKSLFR